MNDFFQFAVLFCKKHDIKLIEHTFKKIETEFFNLYWNSDILSWEPKLNVRKSLQFKWKYLTFESNEFESFKHKFEFILLKQLGLRDLQSQGKISNGCFSFFFNLFKKS